MTKKERERLVKIVNKMLTAKEVSVPKCGNESMDALTSGERYIRLTDDEYDFIEPFLKANYEFKCSVGKCTVVTTGDMGLSVVRLRLVDEEKTDVYVSFFDFTWRDHLYAMALDFQKFPYKHLVMNEVEE